MKSSRAPRSASPAQTRIPLLGSVRLLERLHFIALAGCGFLIGLGVVPGRLPNWPRLVLIWLGLLAMVLVVVKLSTQEERLAGWVRQAINFYPLVTILVIYEMLGCLIPAVTTGTKDDALLSFDRALFGFDPAIRWEAYSAPWLTDLFYLAYATYYFFPIVLGFLLWNRSAELGREFVFSITFSFFVVYLGYVLVPAQGPRVSLATQFQGRLEVSPIAQWISSTLNALEHNRWDVFPSGHVLITILCLIWAFPREKTYFAVGLPLGFLLIISTIYCRLHYVVDVLVGGVLAFGLYPQTRWIYRRF